jgi:hypothetical protein
VRAVNGAKDPCQERRRHTVYPQKNAQFKLLISKALFAVEIS